MIPPRMLNGDNSGTGVRFRVSACRKRLRVSRSGQRPNVSAFRAEEIARNDEETSRMDDIRRTVNLHRSAQEEAEGT